MIRQLVLVTSEASRRQVAGVQLDKRAILVASRAGFERVLVVGPPVDLDPELAALALRTTAAASWEEARAQLAGPFALVTADAVFDVGLAKAAAAASGDARIAIRGVPTGLRVVAEPSTVASLEAALSQDVPSIDVAEGLWHVAATPDELRRAEDALFKSLGKRTDGPVSRLLNRHVSTFVTRRLVRTNVTPNQMTIVANVIGALGVILVFRGTWGMVALGAFLVQMQSILDGCDGEIARLKFKSSKIGEWLDNVLDDQVNVGYGVALGFAGAAMTGADYWRWVGIGAGSAFMIHNLIFYYQLAFIHRSGNPFNFRWWFEKPGVDVTAMLDTEGVVAKLGYLLRALIRRDVFLLGFCFLAAAGFPHVAALWYAAIAASQFALMMVHVAKGGPPAASRMAR